MIKIAIYGKGGIGKSTISTHLSAAFASQGKKVLHVGCDAKADSTIKLIKRKRPITVNDVLSRTDHHHSPRPGTFIMKGPHGIDCIEAGGPEPGMGCGGRGISRMFELFEKTRLLEDSEYDIVLFDVLGDVVCGGFAAPLIAGMVQKVFVVISDEIMSLYVANNLCKAVDRYRENGVSLGGFIVNKTMPGRTHTAERFAKAVRVPILGILPFAKDIIAAEKQRTTTFSTAPRGRTSAWFQTLTGTVLDTCTKRSPRPAPLTQERFFTVLQK